MFSKVSRYDKLSDHLAIDAGGRVVKSKSMRWNPEVTGDLLHSLEEKDRLDHLAYAYYKKPYKWWHICDANPGIPSPLALLGKEPLITTRVPVRYDNNGETLKPPWYKLLKRLTNMTGVEEVRFLEQTQLAKQVTQYQGQAVEIQIHQFNVTLHLVYNRLNVTMAEIGAAIKEEDSGFQLGEPETVGRLGKNIKIPPEAVG